MAGSEKSPLVCTPHIIRSATTVAEFASSKLVLALKSIGFDVYGFRPDWDTPDPYCWAQGMAEHTAEVAHETGKKPVMFGFSGGAIVSTLATAVLERRYPGVEIAGLANCSQLPWWGAAQVESYLQVPGNTLSDDLASAFSELELPQLSSPIQLYVGSQELPSILEMHEVSLERWPHAESIKPTCSYHSVLHPDYFSALQANLGRLATEV